MPSGGQATESVPGQWKQSTRRARASVEFRRPLLLEDSMATRNRDQRLRPHRALRPARGAGAQGGPRGRRHQRPRQARRRWPTCSSTTRCTAPGRARSRPPRRAIVVDGKRSASPPRRTRRKLPWKELGVDMVLECTGRFTDREGASHAPGRGRQEGDHLRAGQGPGRHARLRHQPRDVRPGEAPHHLQRLVHHQLPGARRQGAARHLRHREGPDDHRPQLHQRPAHPGPAAQGPAPRARGGAVDDPHHHRRGQGDRRGAAGAQGQAGRHWRCACRRRTCRWSTSPSRLEKTATRRGDQRRVQEGAPRARSRACSSTARR